jgi:serine protease
MRRLTPLIVPVLLCLACSKSPSDSNNPNSSSVNGKIAGTLGVGPLASPTGLYLPERGPAFSALPSLLEAAGRFRLRNPHSALVRTPTDKKAFTSGEVLVRVSDPGLTAQDVLARLLLPGYELRYLASVAPHWHLVGATVDGQPLDDEGTLALAVKLNSSPGVSVAEPNQIHYPLVTPNDPHYPHQWHYGLMQLPAAWELTTGGPAVVVVAVVDTGILPQHPDLRDRLLPGVDMISDAARAGDGDGRDDDPTDMGKDQPQGISSWHGTHVMGTIGAIADNDQGVVGVDWKCNLLPVRVLGVGGGSLSDIAAGMAWAVGLHVNGVPDNPNPAQVVNMSLGGSSPPSQVYQDVIDEANARGAVFVVAAGNENVDAKDSTPANNQGVIVVGAVAPDGARASYSNFGALVDVVAPGGEQSQAWEAGILSTQADQDGVLGYDFKQGTSMATPHVAGLVALLKGLKPTLKVEDVRGILRSTANTQYQCSEGCGAGLVDAFAAVRAAGGGPATGAANLVVTTSQISLTGSGQAALGFANTGAAALTVTATAGGTQAIRVSFPKGASATLSAGGTGSLLVAFDASGLAVGDYDATVALDAGAAGNADVGVHVRVAAQGDGKKGVVAAVYQDAKGEWQVGGGVEFKSLARIPFSIADLPPRDYYVAAAVDDNGNGDFFEDGERFGLYRSVDAAAAVTVRAGQTSSGIDFALLASAAPAASAPVGDPCAGDSDCSGGSCDTTMPGGYCTAACDDQTPCPAGSDCFDVGTARECLMSCTGTGQANCRSQYACWQGTTSDACFPSCTLIGCESGFICDPATGVCQ